MLAVSRRTGSSEFDGLLAPEDKVRDVTVFGAHYVFTPCGVISTRRRGKVMNCFHMRVSKRFSEKGVEGALLKAVLSYAAEQECKSVRFCFIAKEDYREKLSKVLAELGFEDAELTERIFHTRTYQNIKPILRVISPSKGYDIPFWRDLPVSMKEELSERYAEDSFKFPDLFPLNEKGEDVVMDTENSFALTFEDSIVGWSLCKQTASDTLAYSSIYVEDEHRKKSPRMGYALLGKTIRTHIERRHKLPNAVMCMPLAVPNYRLVERYIKPHADAIHERYSAFFYFKDYDSEKGDA